MENDRKAGSIISFNNYSTHDEEETLVVNSPNKKPNEPNRRPTVEKGCMTDSEYLYPATNNTESNNFSSKCRTNALVIGEMPISLNELHHSTNIKTKSIKDSSQFSINFIDTPSSSESLFTKTSLKPYLILPFSSAGVKKNKNSDSTKKLNSEKLPQIEPIEVGNEIHEKKEGNESITTAVVEDKKPAEEQKVEPKEEVVVREQWSRKTEFLLAIIGFSVDLGNIWRFPKVVYENGGGRFLIPYFVQLALCGLPLFYMELALGQFHQTGLFTLWEKICPILKGLAFTAIIIDLFMAMFYNTVIAWAVYYLLLSFRKEVPWKDCKNEWNTICCFPINKQLTPASNYTLEPDFYQQKSKKGYIYEVNNVNTSSIDNRIVMFDTESSKSGAGDLSAIFQHINDFFKDVLPYSLNFPSIDAVQTNLTTFNNSIQAQIDAWVKSYFILNGNNIEQAPTPYIPLSKMAKYVYDPELLTNLIEKNIEDIYTNQTVSIILNCGKHLNNPTQEFYTRYLTEMHRSTGLDDLGSLKLPMIFCLLIVFITVYFALWQGIKSAGKAVWITAIAPYIVLFILLIRGLTLEGAGKGLSFYLTIKEWGSLLEMKVWVDAATQIFFSLGPGFGTIIALSSYNKKTNNCYKDALLTSFINCFTSILSGFVVFSTLGHMAHVQGKTIEEVTQPGPGLIFITYPQAISMMPGAPIWAIIFFFMLFTLGIDSTFGGLESVITGICDTFPNTVGKKRSWFVLGLIGVCFLCALPTVTYGGPYIVHLFDNFAVAPSILIVVFLEVIGVMYAYGCDRFCDDIYSMFKSKPNKFWIVCWKYISPAIVVVITIMICSGMVQSPLEYGNGYIYYGLGEALAGLIVGVPISFILLYVIYRVYQTEGTLKERFTKLVKPTEPWIRANHESELILEKEIVGDNVKLEKLSNAKYIIVNFNQTVRDAVNL